jgi:hypothetical protein
MTTFPFAFVQCIGWIDDRAGGSVVDMDQLSAAAARPARPALTCLLSMLSELPDVPMRRAPPVS